MANVLLPSFYGVNVVEYLKGVQGISLQLHITAECDQTCKHCYMYNSSFYSPQRENPMSRGVLFNLIDEYYAFLQEYKTTGFVAITGGDPILSPYFFDLLEHIHDNYLHLGPIQILGNPYHVHHDSAVKMKELGVHGYQISIDGLRETHDYFRKKGSFDDSLRALKVLHEVGIKTMVSFTLSKRNAAELLPLVDFLNERDYVDGFFFDRLVPTGNGRNLSDDCFTPKEYKAFLFNVLAHETLSNSRLFITKKDQMWRPLLFELGLLDPIAPEKNKPFLSGCNCGTGSISVLADGTFFSCRRLELSSGKYPEKSFKELFINNKVTELFRRHENYKGCSDCEANVVCRGCPAMKFASTGDFYGMDPNCWRSNCGEQAK